MRMHKWIRYFGLLLMILSLLASAYLVIPGGIFLDQTAVSADTPQSVLIVATHNIGNFGELRTAFDRMGIRTEVLLLDESEQTQNMTAEIKNAINSDSSDRMAVVAYGKTGYPALSACADSKNTTAVCLVAPVLSQSDDLSFLGTGVPIFPIGIVSPDDLYIRSLYERLSGEDARLFPGVSGAGQSGNTSYVSPDGKRLLTLWNVAGSPLSMESVFPLIPGVSEEIVSFFGIYVLHNNTLSDSAREAVVFTRNTAIFAVVVAVAGLFLFVSSIAPAASRPKAVLPQERPDSTSGRTEKAGERDRLFSEDIFSDSVTRARYQKKFLLLSFVGSVFIGILCGILYFTKREFITYPVLCWPVLYYSIAAILLPERASSIRDRKVNPARKRMSTVVMLLFFGSLLGPLFGQKLKPVESLMSVKAAVALFLFAILLYFVRQGILSKVLLQPVYYSDCVFFHEQRRTVLLSRWMIALPTVVLFVIGSVCQNMGILLLAVTIFLSLCAAFLLRHIFHVIGGSAGKAATAFAVFLLFISFL